MSESVSIETSPSAILHPVVVEGPYLVRWDRYRSRQVDPAAHWTETGRLWDLPLGGVVQDWMDSRYWLVTRTGLERIDYIAAFDALDPAGARSRAIQRCLEHAAQPLGIRRKLERVQGEHGLIDGVHIYVGPNGPSAIYAERISARRAYARVATPDEAEEVGFVFDASGRDVTVLCLASGGAHPVEGAGAGSAPLTQGPTP